VLIADKEPHGNVHGSIRVVGPEAIPNKLTIGLQGKYLRLGIVDVVDGEFELREVPAGDYRLRIEGRFEKVDVPASVQPGVTTDVGTIELRTPGKISGRVLDSRGVAFSGANVYVNIGYYPGFTKNAFVHASAVTDERGRFECVGLRSDGAHLLVWSPGWAPIQTFLKATAQSRGLEFRMARSGTIRVIHLPTKGKGPLPVLSHAARLTPADPPQSYGSYATKRLLDGFQQLYSVKNPRVDFVDLPPGRYAITVGIHTLGKSGPRDRKVVTLDEGKLVEVDWSKN